MSITSDDLTLVRDCLDKLRQDFDQHSMVFYDSLFKRAPHMRAMFRDDLVGQGMKFMTTLDVIVQKLDNEDQIADQYKGLGRSHARLGIQATDFTPMEEALIDTLKAALDDFTPEQEAAWRNAFGVVAGNMIERGGIDA